MKRYFRRGILPLVCLLLSSASALRGDEGRISGYFFGDYYYVLKSSDAAFEDRNGFQYRRVYFNYDKELSDAFSMRFRLEMNGQSFPTARQTSSKIVPFLKKRLSKVEATQVADEYLFGNIQQPDLAEC